MEILSNPTLTVLKHGLSLSSHLILFILLAVSWLCKNKITTTGLSMHCRKKFLSASVTYSLFNIFITVFNYYINHLNWSDEDLAAQFDLVVTTLVWVLIFVYLYVQKSELKPPIFLRVWWVVFSIMSCCFLVFDVVLYATRNNYYGVLPMIQDVISVGIGFYLCFLVVLVGKKKSDTSLMHEYEPLLDSSVRMEEEEKTCPFSTSNFFGILTFSWLNPLLALGNQKQISVDDVPLLPFDDSVEGIFPVFTDKLLSGDGNISSLKLSTALLLSTLGDIVCTALLSIINVAASLVGPYFISSFVQYLDDPQKFRSRGYMLVSAFIMSKIVQSLSQRHLSFKLEQVGIRIHEALVATIYRKLLTLSTQSRHVYSCGEVVNFISIDVEKVSSFSLYLHDWWKVPLQVISALLILYMNLGFVSALTFIATGLILWGIVPVHKLQENLHKKLMDSKDGRMKATTEVLKNMKILKLYGWEMKFLSKIFTLRENEEIWLRKYVYIRILSTVIFFVSPTIVAAVTFGACVVTGIPLVSGNVLSAIAIFGMLKEAMFDFPYSISALAQARVSIGRISSFLCLSDLKDDIVVKLPITSNVAIEVENGNFSWDLSSNSFMMKDLNFRVIRGMRVGVCGTVGSGKSSLLSCILGEMIKFSGDVRVCGKKAYVSQSPWIQSGKVEENILFGKAMDRERYERVLQVCCLKKDLEMFPFGDQTIIGERGINLSGGQKQRIQIARAIYQDADTYLFDDPFSALDAHTGMHLYKECLLKFLDSKTVFYVTNQVEFLPSADLILVLKDGTIAQSGSYNEILKPGTYFSDLVGIHQKALLVHKDSIVETEGLAITTGRKHCPEIGVAEEENKGLCQITKDINEILENQEQLVKEEEREQGRVGAHVYWDYITTYKGALVPVLLMVVLILSNLLQIGSDYWMAWDTPVSKDTKSNVEASTLIIVYMSLAFGSCFFVFVRAMITGTAGYKTATILFRRMHLCIFRAPMSFFDSTPSGRILNRASTDQGDIDYNIPAIMGGFAANTIKLLGVISIMALGAWQVCIIYVPVAVACIFYQQYHTAAARELARLIGVCDAPLKQHFTESISGMTTIKSFDQESRFMSTNMKLIDRSLQPKFYSTGANEWLGFRLDVLSSFTFALTLIFLVSMPGGVIDPAIAGLAVTYGLNLSTLQAFVIWLFGLLESDIIAVERILQYTRIPNEAPLVIDTRRPDSKWPLHGEVSIHNLEVRYAPNLPLILRGVTCTFPGEMKTGIVGRTGSGKSTLIQTMFRIMEASSGKILIDGVDISNIGLHDLRSKLSIIPQDPTMFEGTVRSNLDPLEEYTDNQIWEALDKCQLGDEVRRKEQKLDSPVMENGENWSMGQRQLVCLGRVVLKKSKILVLDEATSSVDTATDALMQKTLRHHFSDSTVITIAHRITSVLDSDMVLVMENGKVLEYDSPNKLLGNKLSSFAKLVAEHVGASTS